MKNSFAIVLILILFSNQGKTLQDPLPTYFKITGQALVISKVNLPKTAIGLKFKCITSKPTGSGKWGDPKGWTKPWSLQGQPVKFKKGSVVWISFFHEGDAKTFPINVGDHFEASSDDSSTHWTNIVKIKK